MTWSRLLAWSRKANQGFSIVVMALFYLLIIGFGRLLWQAGQLFREQPEGTYWEDGENTIALDSAY